MSEQHPENEPGTPGDENQPEPVHAEFQHRAVTARLREEVRGGVFANAAIVLSGNFEFVIDFVLRLGKPDLIMARIVLPIPVTEQFVKALRGSIENYEREFGEIPPIPVPARSAEDENANQENKDQEDILSHGIGSFVGATTPEGTVSGENIGGTSKKGTPTIEEIYDDLKLEDDILGGVYANAVLLRHSATEFCFDFVTNFYPRSSVNARVFMAAPQVKPLLNTIAHSFEQFRTRHAPPPENE